MNEKESAKKFERDFQDTLQGKTAQGEGGLTPIEKRRIELAGRLAQLDFSQKSAQRAILRARLLKDARKTLPRRFRMKQIRNRLSPVWAGIGLVGLVILLIVGMSLVLSRMNPTPAGTTPTPSATSSNATPDVNAGNVTITFADLYMDEWTDYQALANAFHKQNPNITVVIIPVDHTIQLADADIAKQADVIYLNGYNPGVLPGFLALQPLVDATTGFKLDAFWPGSTAACSDAQGNLYGLPLTMNLEGIYYNPIIFDQAHVAYPQPGWTWSQFQQTITQVAGTANGVNVYGFVEGVSDYILFPFLEKALIANDGKLDAQALSASLNWYVQLAKEKKLYPVQPPDRPDGGRTTTNLTPLVTGGQTAMWTFSTAYAYNAPLIKGSVYVPYPIDPADDHTTPASPFCGAISSATKNSQAAWAWLDFLSQQDLTGGGSNPNLPVYLPGRSSLAKASPYWTGLTDEQKSAMTYGLDHAWYFPASLWGANPLGSTFEAIARALHDGTDMLTALQGVAATSGSSAQDTPTPAAGPVVLNTAPVPTNLPGGVLTINFNENSIMGMDPAYTYNGPAIQALVTAFEKLHPEINVALTASINWPADNDVIHQLAQGNDCFESNGPTNPTLTLSDTDLLDLNTFLEADPSMKNDFYPAFLKPYEVDGKLLGLPADVSVQYIAYNTDLLTQLGIPLPKAGWTVDDLISIASQAANPSASVPIYGFAGGDNLFRSQGVSFYDTSVQPPRATFTTETMVKTFTWLQGLFQKKIVYQQIYYTFSDYLKMIANGQMALWVTSGSLNYNPDPWDMSAHPIFDQNLSFKVGFVPLPLTSSGVSMGSPMSTEGYYISSHTPPEKATACWAWIQYLSGQPSVFGGYSPRQSVLPKEKVGEDPARFAAVQAAIQQFNDNGYADYGDPLLWVFNSEYALAMESIQEGGDASAALAKAQSSSDAYLACISQKDLTGLSASQLYMLVQSCYVIPTPPPTATP